MTHTIISDFISIVSFISSGISSIFNGLDNVGIYDNSDSTISISILDILLGIIFFKLVVKFIMDLISEQTEEPDES